MADADIYIISCYSHHRYSSRFKDHTPSVESTIVPSKSESTPSKVKVCAGAEKDSAADMAGEGLCGEVFGMNLGERGREKTD